LQIIVQIVLVLAVIIVSLALMRGGSNARHLVIFAVVAALSIFFPELLTMLARSLGIGRGTDLVLYGLIVSFMVFMATTYQRFRHMETTLTQLSRRIAIDETPRPWLKDAPQSTSTLFSERMRETE
jgi:small membrane protein